MILVLGKARSCRVPNLGCRGAESTGWFDVLPKSSVWDVIYEQVHCRDEAANHQLLIAAGFWIIRIVSIEECSSLMQIWCRFIALFAQLFWMRWSQYTCSLNGIYHPQWLVQWSHHCPHMHSPLSLAARLYQCHTNFSCYINNGWTFLDRPLHIQGQGRVILLFLFLLIDVTISLGTWVQGGPGNHPSA